MPTNVWSTIRTSFRRKMGMRSTPSTVSISTVPASVHLEVHVDYPITSRVINSLMRTNRHLQLLMPVIVDPAIISPPSHTSYGNGNRTTLHWAVIHEHPPLLRKLLQSDKADTILTVPDRHGATPLHSATFLECKGMVEMLLNKGAKRKHQNGRRTRRWANSASLRRIPWTRRTHRVTACGRQAPTLRRERMLAAIRHYSLLLCEMTEKVVDSTWSSSSSVFSLSLACSFRCSRVTSTPPFLTVH